MPVDPIAAYSMPVDTYKGGFSANYGSMWDKPGDDVNLPLGYGTTTFGAKSGTTGDIPGALGGTELEASAALGEYEPMTTTGFIKPPEDYTAEIGESWQEADYSDTEKAFETATDRGELRRARRQDWMSDRSDRQALLREWAVNEGVAADSKEFRQKRRSLRRQQRKQRKDLFQTYKGGL